MADLGKGYAENPHRVHEAKTGEASPKLDEPREQSKAKRSKRPGESYKPEQVKPEKAPRARNVVVARCQAYKGRVLHRGDDGPRQRSLWAPVRRRSDLRVTFVLSSTSDPHHNMNEPSASVARPEIARTDSSGTLPRNDRDEKTKGQPVSCHLSQQRKN